MVSNIMRVFPIIILHTLMVGCKGKKSEIAISNMDRFDKRTIHITKCEERADKFSSDTLTVELEGGIKLLWDKLNDRIIKDSVFLALGKYHINKNIVNSISDTTNLYLNVCSKSFNLRKGDVAFIALCDLNQIHIAKDLGYQFDVYDPPCKYPYGMLDCLEFYRDEFKEKILRIYFK